MIMPYGGTDWLALTQEPTLEPEIPICDPHHHFWDRQLQSMPYQRYLLDVVACRHLQRAQYPVDSVPRGALDVPPRRSGGHASRRGGGIRPGSGGGECQWD